MSSPNDTIKDVIRNWALVSKAHGIANIARNQHFALRAIWIACFLGSFSYCKTIFIKFWLIQMISYIYRFILIRTGTYQIVVTVITFLRYDVTTSYSDIPEAPALFPAVAFCNLNPLDFIL
jgi:hypothetical protein